MGVYTPEQRAADTLFIEFDPTVAAQQSASQLILPFAAAPLAARELPFYLHTWGGCSSTLIPHGRTDAERPAFIAAGVAACEAVVRELPPSLWRSNDHTYPDEVSFRASFPAAANSCFVCGDYRNITGVRRFKAVALAEVVQLLPAVDLLDIDAQVMTHAGATHCHHQHTRCRHRCRCCYVRLQSLQNSERATCSAAAAAGVPARRASTSRCC